MKFIKPPVNVKPPINVTPPEKQLTYDEKLDILNLRLKKIQTAQMVSTAIAILVFIGIINFQTLKNKVLK
jgi:hypothetical protein